MREHGLGARIDLAHYRRRETSLLQTELYAPDTSEQSSDFH